MAKGNKPSLVKLRGAVWYENFSVRGRKFRGSLGTGDRDIADTLATAKKAEALIGHLTGAKPQITLAQAVIRHWNDVAQHWNTARQAQIHNKTLLDHLGGDTILSALDFGRLASFVATRRARLENASVNREVAHLRAIVNSCAAWGYRVPDPPIAWRTARGPSLWLDEPDNKQTLLPEAKEDSFIASLREDFRAAVRFAIMTGQRRENILGLKWDQVDWDLGTITFRVKSKKPGRKLHVLPLTAGMRALLSLERGRHPDFVFTYLCRHSVHGRRRGQRYPLAVDGGNFRRDFERARAAIGLPSLRFHDLRHTFGTRLAAVAPLGRVQQAMGHASVNTTMRYSTTTIEDVRDALERLEAGAGPVGTQIGHKAQGAGPKKDGTSNA